jgi:mono/diheme cytochrome c family protein
MNALKKIGVGATAASLFGLMLLTPMGTGKATASQELSATNAADFYRAKCTACHGANADKRFDSTLSDDQLIDAVMKGKKAEKPPNMPSFEVKGVTIDQARGLIEYMKQLKTAAGS